MYARQRRARPTETAPAGRRQQRKRQKMTQQNWTMIGRSDGGWACWVGLFEDGLLVEDDPGSMAMKVKYMLTREIDGVVVDPDARNAVCADLGITTDGHVFDPEGKSVKNYTRQCKPRDLLAVRLVDDLNELIGHVTGDVIEYQELGNARRAINCQRVIDAAELLIDVLKGK